MPFLPRPSYDWHLRSRTLALGQRTIIMGILNVTPDSFSDGGYFYSAENAPERALAHAIRLLDEGAQILDIGGETTRPNATPLTANEEQARILPVIEAILAHRPEVILSVDTYHAATAKRAVEAGVEIVNDVSGFLWDTEMAATCAALRCGLVLMHTRGRPQEWRELPPLAPQAVVPMVLNDLAQRLDEATSAGIARNRIVLDPGVGFGKLLDENYPLLSHFDELQELGLPLLLGASRKGFLAHTIASLHGQGPPAQEPPAVDARLHATIAASVAAILNGAHIVRVHDVLAAAEAAAVADRILSLL
ncbi:dihydropteroate synthase [Edaphobacter bradus]|uniref:dihydropteroate synthase n=1 Tax=Edaphobacter bradus TaxID=2259016 RepID=UPI0021E0FAE4|nr:dihydropteroate synthase [Edaphobacter bradus]